MEVKMETIRCIPFQMDRMAFLLLLISSHALRSHWASTTMRFRRTSSMRYLTRIQYSVAQDYNRHYYHGKRIPNAHL